jgi:hypothetical protein
MKSNTSPTAWAWEIKNGHGKWVLCHWAEPYRKALLMGEKPSPEARAVCVRLVRRSVNGGES